MGGSFVLQPGSWSGAGAPLGPADNGVQLPWVEAAAHLRSEWDQHIRIVTSPKPIKSELWTVDTTDPGTDTTETVLPLHGPGLPDAVAHIIDAASRWGCPPDQLALTFRGN